MLEDDYEVLNGYTCLIETDDAIQVETGEGVEYWIPKAIIGEYSDVQGQGDHGDLIIARWFAEKNCLE